jgi:hypothetical protein
VRNGIPTALSRRAAIQRGQAGKATSSPALPRPTKGALDTATLRVHAQFVREPPPNGDVGIVRVVQGFRFAPLVCDALKLVASLEITLLRREPPGSILSRGGDIDNRLKTLLDSLKVPDQNALPADYRPPPGTDPLFCLLEDDNRITSLTVHSDRLLEQTSSPSWVVLILKVRVIPTLGIMANMGIA